jgi:beta-galactosidase
VHYLEQAHAAYEALRASGVTVDFVAPGASLDGYGLVVVPSLYLVEDSAVEVLTQYVAGGGTALVTFFSGVVDGDDRIRLDATGATPPGAFAELLGAWTEQFFPLVPEQAVHLSDGSTAAIWTERVRLTTAKAIASFVDGPVAGSPAITRNSLGAGTAWYAATALDQPGFAALVAGILGEAGVPRVDLPAGVELVVRSNAKASYTVVINHTGSAVTLAMTGHELITAERVEQLDVPAGGVRVLRAERSEQ